MQGITKNLLSLQPHILSPPPSIGFSAAEELAEPLLGYSSLLSQTPQSWDVWGWKRQGSGLPLQSGRGWGTEGSRPV